MNSRNRVRSWIWPSAKWRVDAAKKDVEANLEIGAGAWAITGQHAKSPERLRKIVGDGNELVILTFPLLG